MKFLKKISKYEKTIIVLSDLHLGAGQYIDGKRNPLEDFHFDKELVNLFEYFSSGDYENAQVEIVFNGDFLDFLSTPFIQCFDDEFWSEESAVQKLSLIRKAHPEVFIAMNNFVKVKNKKIVYVIGNHDAEIILPAVQEKFLSYFSVDVHQNIVLPEDDDRYIPLPGIHIMHGHQFERAHYFKMKEAILVQEGKRYIRPTWGSYYCNHILNKYKIERDFINQIHPIRNFLIHGMLYDTFFTLRFILANIYYFVMVRFWPTHLFRLNFKKIANDLKEELILFQNYAQITRNYFKKNKDAKYLLVGHTHQPMVQSFQDETVFINTGTWCKMISLDFSNLFTGHYLTFAMINAKKTHYPIEEINHHLQVNLFSWKGDQSLPFESQPF